MRPKREKIREKSVNRKRRTVKEEKNRENGGEVLGIKIGKKPRSYRSIFGERKLIGAKRQRNLGRTYNERGRVIRGLCFNLYF